MASGYSTPLYPLAFDHPPTPSQFSGRSSLIADAAGRSVAVRPIADHCLETVNGFAV
jgi:hypothetical protein